MSTPPPGPTGSEKIHRKDSEHTEATRSEVERISSRSESVEAGQANISDNPNLDAEEKKRLEASAKLENPLAGLSQAELAQRGEEFSRKHGFAEEEDIRAFRLGAMIAGNMNKYDTVEGLTEREKDVLDREITHKWSNPTMLYAVIV